MRSKALLNTATATRSKTVRADKRYDVIIVGLGAYGSAVAHYAAKLGLSVLAIDRYNPPHDQGSTHGESRIFRSAIGEGEEYAQLAVRTQELWKEMERETGRNLFEQVGCLTIGNAQTSVHGVDDFFGNMKTAAERHHIPHMMLENGADIRQSFPQFKARDDEKAFFDMWGGYAIPETVVESHLDLAKKYGATILTNTPVKSYRSSGNGVSVTTESGETYHTDRLLLSAGPWVRDFLPDSVKRLLKVTRQVLYWFEMTAEAAKMWREKPTTFIWDFVRPGNKAKADVYGFPPMPGEDRIKISHEEVGVGTTPDTVNRKVSRREMRRMYQTYIKPFFPGVGPRCVKAKVCFYTIVDGARFLIDKVPGQPRVMFVSACSGHGFKHAAAVGEAIAEVFAVGTPRRVDLRPFTLARFRKQQATQHAHA